MISILIIAIGAIITVMRILSITRSNDPRLTPGKLLVPVSIFIFFVIIAFVSPFKMERVDAGHVGIKVNLTGDNRGVSKFEYKTGWVIIIHG